MFLYAVSEWLEEAASKSMKDATTELVDSESSQ